MNVNKDFFFFDNLMDFPNEFEDIYIDDLCKLDSSEWLYITKFFRTHDLLGRPFPEEECEPMENMYPDIKPLVELPVDSPVKLLKLKKPKKKLCLKLNKYGMYRTSKWSSNENIGKIQAALWDIKFCKLGKSTASRKYNIPVRTLARRIKQKKMGNLLDKNNPPEIFLKLNPGFQPE
jgi:hypothetical protein